jgi:hypothetical protein
MTDAIQRARRFLAEHRPRQHDDQDRRKEQDRRTFGERQIAHSRKEADRRSQQHRRPQQLHRQSLRAPEARAGAMPCEGRHDQHLPGVAGPDDEKQRVALDEVLRRRVERSEAKTGQQKDGQRSPRLEVLDRTHHALDGRAQPEVHRRRLAHTVIGDLERAEAAIVVEDFALGFRQWLRRIGAAHRRVGAFSRVLVELQAQHDRGPSLAHTEDARPKSVAPESACFHRSNAGFAMTSAYAGCITCAPTGKLFCLSIANGLAKSAENFRCGRHARLVFRSDERQLSPDGFFCKIAGHPERRRSVCLAKRNDTQRLATSAEVTSATAATPSRHPAWRQERASMGAIECPASVWVRLFLRFASCWPT